MGPLAVSLFSTWAEEKFFRYMRQHYSLDRLVEYGTELIPESVEVVNPQWRQLDNQIRSKAATALSPECGIWCFGLSRRPFRTCGAEL